LRASIDLVRKLMVPDRDIHPEMVSHTRVIDTKTGRPYEDSSEYFMENWRCFSLAKGRTEIRVR
jgi:hypothetical protein